MRTTPSNRHPWWHRRTGWYAIPLVALISLIVISNATSSAGAMAQTAAQTAADPADEDGTGTGPCPSTMQLTPGCFLLTPSEWKDFPLAPDDPSNTESYVGLKSATTIPSVKWEFWLQGGGRVRLHNLAVNRCLNVWPSNKRPWLDQCHVSVPGDQSFAEDFYVRGVDGKPGLYRVVSASYPSLCLTNAGGTAGTGSDGNGIAQDVLFRGCDRTADTQYWNFSGVGNANDTTTSGADWLLPYVRRLALEQCDIDKDSCQWKVAPGTKTGEADVPTISTTSCVGPVEHNWGTTAQPGTGALTYRTTESNESANTQGTSSSVAVKTWLKPLIAFGWMPSPFQLSYGVTSSNFSEYGWARKQETQQAATIDAIAPGEWGWFSQTSYQRQLPGTWTFAREAATQFTATFTKFNVPSYAPGTTKDVILTAHTSVNPPDADCSDPVENKPAVKSWQGTGAVGRPNYSELNGMEFETSSKRLKVSALGRQRMTSCPGSTGTAGQVTVGIYQALPRGGGVQAIPGASVTVKLGTVDGGEYAYTALPEPLFLEPNSSYYLLTSVSPTQPCVQEMYTVTLDSEFGLTEAHRASALADGSDLQEIPDDLGRSLVAVNMKVSD